MEQFFDSIFFLLQRLSLASAVDLFLVTAIFFTILLFLRGSRAMVLLRGILSLYILISLLVVIFDLPAFTWLATNSIPAILVAIPVLFAPEIRRGLERLGRVSDFLIANRDSSGSRDVLSLVTHAATRLAERRHGALIVLQRLDNLGEYVETGVPLGAHVSAELLLQIFYPNTPLHDGAVIIADRRVAGAGCVMPLSSSGVLSKSPDRNMGLRHRAALGTSEVSDSVAIVISEETGAISVAFNGRMIHRLGRERLEGVLRAFYEPIENPFTLEELLYRFLPFIAPRKKDITEV
jgi:diadenylate cyclase